MKKERKPETAITEQRLDKWLKIALIFKSRSRGTTACEERRVKVNGDVVKPSKMIKVGDELTVKKHAKKFIKFTIKALSAKNIPAKEAREMYELDVYEISEESQELLSFYRESEKNMRVKYKGRPTKKVRRQLDNVRRQQHPGLS